MRIKGVFNDMICYQNQETLMQKKADQLILELGRKYRQEQSDTQVQEQQGFREFSL